MPFLPAHLCEHPNEVPHACPCLTNCYCRQTTCPLPTTDPRLRDIEPKPQPKGQWDRLLADEQPPPLPQPPEPLAIVRLWDMFDGWMDITKPIPESEAKAIWNEKTAYGTKNIKYNDGDYYAIYPADTRMLVTPEFLGR